MLVNLLGGVLGAAVNMGLARVIAGPGVSRQALLAAAGIGFAAGFVGLAPGVNAGLAGAAGGGAMTVLVPGITARARARDAERRRAREEPLPMTWEERQAETRRRTAEIRRPPTSPPLEAPAAAARSTGANLAREAPAPAARPTPEAPPPEAPPEAPPPPAPRPPSKGFLGALGE